jgi:RNA polymerase sigma factor (sigma-70 family)
MRQLTVDVHRPLTSSDLVELFGSFQHHLELIVRGTVRAPAPVIEDACQAAWLRLIRDREHIAFQSAPGWLVTTAIHAARRMIRHEDREESLELALEHSPQESFQLRPGPEEVVWRRQRVFGLRSLSVRQQRLVWLRALGLSYDEMARHEGCTNRTVRRQLERARQALRAQERCPGDRQAA